MQQGVGDELLFLEIFYSRLTNYYLKKWTQDKGNSSKLLIYHTFKSELETERYLLMWFKLELSIYSGSFQMFKSYISY